MKIYLIITIAFLMLFNSTYGDTSIDISPDKDNSIFADNTANSSGVGKLFCGRTTENSNRRVLVHFDLSTIPNGVTITSVSLQFFVERVSSLVEVDDMYMYRLTKDWGEGTSNALGGQGDPAVAPDATWLDAEFGTSSWTNPGGDYVASSSATTDVGANTGNKTFSSTAALIADVQNWLDGVNPNYGWILIGNEARASSSRRIVSKDTGTGPMLTVTYSGCDNTTSSFDVSLCDEYISPSGKIWENTGVYTDTIPNTTGCDSIMTIDLTIKKSTGTFFPATACDSYLSPSGKTWYISGILYDTIPNNAGCDSIIIVDLTINKTTEVLYTITACNSYTSPSGKIIEESGIYYDTIPNNSGCDSLISIDLTISDFTSSSQTIDVCGSYTSPSGKLWEETGIYTDTIPNYQGCDSIISIDLTINKASVSSFEISACDSYISPSKYAWEISGIYTDTIPNAVGCDSIMTIDLTINHSTSADFVIISCEEYISPSGKIWEESGVVYDTIPNAAGCDSLITIDLTVNIIDNRLVVDSSTLIAYPGYIYQWLDCENNYAPIEGETGQSFTALVSGSYSVEIMQNDCRDTSECISLIVVGVHDDLRANQIQIYPNPSNGMINIDSEFHILELNIYNIDGSFIQTISQPNANLNLNLPSGSYLIKGKTEKGFEFTKKLLISK